MGKKDILWQDTADVLALFGKTVTDARKSYADYVSKEYEQSIALPSVPGRLNILPQNKTTTKQRNNVPFFLYDVG